MARDDWHGPWRELGAGVFARRYAFLDQEIGLVVGDGAALVVDTRCTLAQAREIRDEVRSVTDVPIEMVVNTHGHWDHCFGNAGFRDVVIVGQRGSVRFIEMTAEEARARVSEAIPELAADLAAVEIVVPTRFVDVSLTVEVGGRRIELSHHGRGHTDHDLVITVPDAAVTFAGDLIEEGAPPSFGDAYPTEWPPTLDRLLEHLPAGPIVPGHGDVVDRDFVARQRDDLRVLASVADRAYRSGATVDAVAGDVPFPRETAVVALERALAQLAGPT